MTQHILLYTSPAIGGVLQYNHSILDALATLGYQVTYVQDIPDGLVKLFGVEGMERTRQRAAWFVNQQKQKGIHQHQWLESATAADAERVVAECKPDLLILSNGGPIANFFPKRAAIKLGIPYIIVEHLVHPIKPREVPAAYAELAQQYVEAKAVIAVSQENLLLLRKLFGLAEDKGQVIYCGRPSSYFQPRDERVRSHLRQQWGIPANAVVCFTAARMDIIKGYQYQIAAIKQLKQTPIWPNLYFAWAGTGTLENQFRQAIQQAGAAEHVKFLGELEAIHSWLDASDIFVLPSESEGLPLAMMEAMAKELPVVATAVSGVPEGLGDTGKLLSSPVFGDSQATIRELVATLQSWAGDATLRQQAGQACKQRAEQLFREERMVEQTLAVIKSVLER
ncbi:MAG: glycosyltransferase family 4 protein [Leptolyngbyaceae cyanobacterium HOT.MB2.61]|nr:glycosyltransferase family 4 protein [Leptolyngbyaceae cyanobacterium HOT.MB2.61]